MRAAVKTRIFLLFFALMLVAAPVSAGYLDVVIPDRLPGEAVPVITQLRELEPFVGQWQQNWQFSQPKGEVEGKVRELYRQTSQLLDKHAENGELHLLGGLLGFYGYNLDLDGYGKYAEAHFSRAVNLLKDDYRPLWLLGMHLSSSTRISEGMREFLEAEKKYSIREPMFWEDYASAAYLSVMLKHAIYALDRVEKLTGKKSRLEGIIGKAVREHVKSPVPNGKIDGRELWDAARHDRALTFVSLPLGYKFTIPAALEPGCRFSDFANRSAMVQFGLTRRTGRKSKGYIPTVLILAHIPSEDESLDDFKRNVLYKKTTWEKFDMGLGLGEISYAGNEGNTYKKEGGARIIAVTFERKCPEYSGFIFEEPANKLNKKDGYFRLVDRYERFRERIFYLIMLETPSSIFDRSRKEFTDILRTFVVE